MTEDDRGTLGDGSLGDDVIVEHEPTITYVPVNEDALSVLTPEQAAAIAGIKGFALIVQRGPQTGKTWLLPNGGTTIGRDPSNDIVLDDITVSRNHCDIELSGDQLVLIDLGSTNGTYVNDKRADRHQLAPGDRLLVGKFHLVVAHGDG
jgi:pSer/pThr/pTyr-binding forkhead associated (FHA) protein